MAGVTRLELATSCVTGKRSNQLNYTPEARISWWAMQGSNLRLQPCKGCTLPTELIARKTKRLIAILKMGVKQKHAQKFRNAHYSYIPKILKGLLARRLNKCYMVNINDFAAIQFFT